MRISRSTGTSRSTIFPESLYMFRMSFFFFLCKVFFKYIFRDWNVSNFVLKVSNWKKKKKKPLPFSLFSDFLPRLFIRFMGPNALIPKWVKKVALLVYIIIYYCERDRRSVRKKFSRSRIIELTKNFPTWNVLAVMIFD